MSRVTPPPVHVPRPYERPHSHCVASIPVPIEDGASISAFVYGPGETRDAPSTPFGIDICHPPVVFLHGNGEEHGIFGPVIDALVAGGHTVVGVDSRGQGQSTRGTAPLSYEVMAADVREVMARLGVPQFHVVGFSDGAILGLILARDHPEQVLSLCSIGANLTPCGLAPESLKEMAEAATANRLWEQAGDEGVFLEDGTPVPTPAEAGQIAELLELMLVEPQIESASLGAIVCPVTVMAGEFDDILLTHTQCIAGSIPSSRLVIVDGADHNLPKMAPSDVTREVIACVARHDVHLKAREIAIAPDLVVSHLDSCDLKAVEKLYRHVTDHPGSSGWVRDIWPPQGMAQRLLEAGSSWGVLSEEGVLLGVVSVDLNANFGDEPDWARLPEGKAASLHLLAADPRARGRHVGSALLAIAIDQARALGASVIRLNTSTQNVEANTLYATHGLTRHRPTWLPYPGLPLSGWTNLWEIEL